jgi:hypothetical protein
MESPNNFPKIKFDKHAFTKKQYTALEEIAIGYILTKRMHSGMYKSEQDKYLNELEALLRQELKMNGIADEDHKNFISELLSIAAETFEPTGDPEAQVNHPEYKTPKPD